LTEHYSVPVVALIASHVKQGSISSINYTVKYTKN